MSARPINVKEIVSDEIMYVDYMGKSTDTKPTEYGKIYVIVDGHRVQKSVGLCTGSSFTEINTGKVFLYDEDGAAGSKWIDQDFD